MFDWDPIVVSVGVRDEQQRREREEEDSGREDEDERELTEDPFPVELDRLDGLAAVAENRQPAVI